MEFKRNEKVQIKAMTGIVKNTTHNGTSVRVAVDGPHPKFWIVVPIKCVEKVEGVRI